MSSVSTAFKVHYNQKLGDLSGCLGGNAPWHLGGYTLLAAIPAIPLPVSLRVSEGANAPTEASQAPLRWSPGSISACSCLALMRLVWLLTAVAELGACL